MVSEDSVRRSFAKLDEAKGVEWLSEHLHDVYAPLLGEPWILDADVTILADQVLIDQLQVLSDELRFVLITSAATLAPLNGVESDEIITLRNGSRILVQAAPSEHQKCVRCWHHREEIGSNAEHPGLCGRCIVNIDGDGEQRRFA